VNYLAVLGVSSVVEYYTSDPEIEGSNLADAREQEKIANKVLKYLPLDGRAGAAMFFIVNFVKM